MLSYQLHLKFYNKPIDDVWECDYLFDKRKLHYTMSHVFDNILNADHIARIAKIFHCYTRCNSKVSNLYKLVISDRCSFR